MDESEALRSLPLASLKYIPYERAHTSWSAPPDAGAARDGTGMPIPPDALMAGYADSAADYLDGGALNVRTMTDKLQMSGFAMPSARRILDFGCGVARMIRHLPAYSPGAELWGVDISAPHIQWCKGHLGPPLHFATTTTIPHLPFADGHFDLVYAGSVFTHIDDLADAWLLELRRVLSLAGRAYITLHDDTTIDLLENDPVYSRHWLADQLRASPQYQERKDTFGMLVIGRDVGSQVFYRREWFTRMAGPSFEVIAVHPIAHGYQTAYVLAPRR